MQNLFKILLCLIFFFFLNSLLFAQKKTEVVILSTLHQFHATNANYSFEILSKTIETIKPDVLALELTPKDLQTGREQKVKLEYAKSVFPLIEKHKYKTVTLEPDEPLFTELINLLKESNKENQEKSPQKVEAFSIYSDALYDYLFKHWNSVKAVNSSETDALFEVKHNFQNSLFGEKEAKVWNDWNTHFLKQILNSAAQNNGKRILVLVGAEHSYWLRKNLRIKPEINLLEIQDFL